ncbi:MAG: carbohydrate kinase family protein [Gemmatimonadaceae bacterium]
MKKVGVLGSFVWDVIHGRDVRTLPVEEWGGITYALAAFDAALPDNWQIVPISKVGHDRARQAREFLTSLRHLAPGTGAIEVDARTNQVELRYANAERRTETLSGGVPMWTWPALQPLLQGLDALYINLISGFELDVETAQLIRQHFKGPIYGDLHSLMLAIQPDGLRTLRPLPNASEWCACVDVVQVNEDEMTMMASDPLSLAATAIARGVQQLVVTLGSRGLVYVNAPGFERVTDRATWQRLAGVGGTIATALVPPPARAVKTEGDPTGCGDVFGATYYSRLLAGDMFSQALHVALSAAVRNVDFRGARGLAAYLRGELIAQ